MKRIKWTIMTLIISLSVGGALATAPQHDCRTDPQYYWTGSGYMPAGAWGATYLCDSGIDICTYTTDGFGNYTGCRQGEYRLITGINKTQKAKAGKK
ncbi:MAG TPA: hypothetical protein VL727_15515 [Puia sp.]|jgi:hypothetical protein|nr:hypothetical protein [Puia sp.]